MLLPNMSLQIISLKCVCGMKWFWMSKRVRRHCNSNAFILLPPPLPLTLSLPFPLPPPPAHSCGFRMFCIPHHRCLMPFLILLCITTLYLLLFDVSEQNSLQSFFLPWLFARVKKLVGLRSRFVWTSASWQTRSYKRKRGLCGSSREMVSTVSD